MDFVGSWINFIVLIAVLLFVLVLLNQFGFWEMLDRRWGKTAGFREKLGDWYYSRSDITRSIIKGTVYTVWCVGLVTVLLYLST